MHKELLRTKARKYSRTEIDRLVDQQLKFVLSRTDPEEIILFGSALGERFDEYSDIDLVLIFGSNEQAATASKKLYRDREKPNLADYVCISREDFDARCSIGGIPFIAKQDGRVIFRKG